MVTLSEAHSDALEDCYRDEASFGERTLGEATVSDCTLLLANTTLPPPQIIWEPEKVPRITDQRYSLSFYPQISKRLRISFDRIFTAGNTSRCPQH